MYVVGCADAGKEGGGECGMKRRKREIIRVPTVLMDDDEKCCRAESYRDGK